ncbi:MAG TPA: ABC transporter permease [Stellaceae bacterium]|nr:ABC transporter permease [Stellaceae bacterium]
MILAAYGRSAVDLVRVMVTHRRLLQALAGRDVRDEYVGHGLAVAWPVIQPLFMMLIYWFCFTKIFPTKVQAGGRLPTDATIYLLSGIIPWIVLSQVMSRSLASVVGNGSIIKQIMFPLELLPLKVLATPLLYGGVSVAFLICYGVYQAGWEAALVYLWGLPLLLALSLPLIVGLSLILSTLQVFLRDFRELVIIFVNVGIFIHPILYFPDAVPAAVRPIIFLSPFSYLLFCWQDIFYFGAIARPWAWEVTAALVALMFVFGARLFAGAKPYFADFL